VSTPTGAELTGHGSALEEEQGIQIHGVLFADDYIEISFLEEREVSDEVSDLRRRIIKSYLFSERIGGILDELVELLTEAAVHRRNPVREFRTPKAALGKEEEE